MKNINLAIFAKRNELVKLFKERDVLVRLSVEFGKDPEGTIYKLTALEVLSGEDQDKFIMYNKGLVGINTKETSISLANAELHKVIKTLSNAMLSVVDELVELNPVSDVVDNVKVLNEYLDDAGVSNLLNVINNDKAMYEYATHKIHAIVSTLANPGADEKTCTDILYSIMDSIVNSVNDLDVSGVTRYNTSVVPKAASIKIDMKNIESNIDSEVNVVDASDVEISDVEVTPSIVSDKLNNYMVTSLHNLDKITLIKAMSVLYNDVKQTEVRIPEFIESLSLSNYSNLTTVIKEMSKLSKRYEDNELTNNEFNKLYSEYKHLTNTVLNETSVVIDSAVVNSDKLNRLTYVLYLTKALIEKILVEATIK